MKTITTVLILLSLNFTFAQNNYEKGMAKAFDFWKTNKTEEAVNLFERIATAEKENWLPFYYAAQIHIITSFNTKDAKILDAKLQKAQDYLNQAKSLSQNNAEIMVMQAMLHTAYVAFDGQTHGPTLAPKVEALYQKAINTDPKNPRAHLNNIEWKMGSARFFGKDPNVYCSDLEKVIVLFKEQKNTDPFYPKWGNDRLEKLIKDCGNF